MSLFLSRLILNPRSKAVQTDLADCVQMHRTVMAAFPPAADAEKARASLGVLYRVDTEPRSGHSVLLVQARVAPDWSHLTSDYLADTTGQIKNPDSKPIARGYEQLRQGMVLLFRLRANPTRKIDTHSGPNGERRNGRRVPLRDEDALVAWLRRKGEEAGFALLDVRTGGAVPDLRATAGTVAYGGRVPARSGTPSAAGKLTFEAALFEGRLLVTDLDRFRLAIEGGIGPGKAYGFGLLSIARASSTIT